MEFQFLTYKFYCINSNLYYGSELQYNFYNIYDKCIFNYTQLCYGKQVYDKTFKNIYIKNNITKERSLLYFDIFYFDIMGDLCFKICEYDEDPKSKSHWKSCNSKSRSGSKSSNSKSRSDSKSSNSKSRSGSKSSNSKNRSRSKLYNSKSFKVERVKCENLYKDFSININDDNCLEKLHILFSSVFNNCNTSLCSTPYDILQHNSNNFMFEEIGLCIPHIDIRQRVICNLVRSYNSIH